MRRGFKKWCEEQSLFWRSEIGLLPYDHLPSRSLASQFDIEVVSPEDIPGLAQKDLEQLLYHDPMSWSAMIVSADGSTIIINNSQNSVARQESDIMHEMAHIICKHDPINFKILPGFPFPLREYRKEDEEEAGWLGACLQIPRDGLLRILKSRNMENEELADHFVASIEMVRFRRNKTAVDAQIRKGRRNNRRR